MGGTELLILKVSEIKGKVNHQARDEKKARFSVAYLTAYQSLVNQLYAAKYFFTPFSSIVQLEFVGNPEICH